MRRGGERFPFSAAVAVVAAESSFVGGDCGGSGGIGGDAIN